MQEAVSDRRDWLSFEVIFFIQEMISSDRMFAFLKPVACHIIHEILIIYVLHRPFQKL